MASVRLLPKTARARLKEISQPTPAPTKVKPRAGEVVHLVLAAIGELSPRKATLAATVVVACGAMLVGGPTAGFVGGAYTTIVLRAVYRHRAGATARRARSVLLDRIAGLAADLRAGRSAPAALRSAGLQADPGARLASLVEAAVALAERTGAPLADLVERIETDARATDRTLATADAQAAGARATAMMLAGLPVGGIALGYAVGAQPLDVLFGTPIGAACSAGTVLLHVLGLAWTARLVPRFR